MGVIYFQLGIGFLIIFITVVHGQKVGLIASVIIAGLTFLNVFMPWLIVIQIITICVSYNIGKNWRLSLIEFKRKQEEARIAAEKRRQELEAQRQRTAALKRATRQSQPENPFNKAWLIVLVVISLSYFVYANYVENKASVSLNKLFFYLLFAGLFLLGLLKVGMRQYYRRRGMYWPDYGNGKEWRTTCKDRDWLPRIVPLANEKRWRELESAALEWSRIGNQNVAALFYLGLAREMLSNIASALHYYNQAYKLNPAFKSPHLQLSMLAQKIWHRKSNQPAGQDKIRQDPLSRLTPQKAWMNSELAKALDVLEMTITATDEEIKVAYRRRITEYHPDKFTRAGKDIRDLAEAKSKEINLAYEIIKNIRGFS